MGKRKRRADPKKTPPPAELIPYSTGMASSSKEKFSHLVETGGLKPLSSIMDPTDNYVKLSNTRHSPVYQHHNFNRAMLSRHPRHYYGRNYSRRNSIKHADASTSHGKGTALQDEKQSLKFTARCDSDSRHCTYSSERTYRKTERIRSSSSAMDALSSDMVRMVCGICQKLLRRKPCTLENMLSSSDLSVVAVLICGHVYHADCLEQRTSHDDRWDPPCPLCLGLLEPCVASGEHH